MCELKYIERQGDTVIADRKIEIKHTNFDLLHRPYFLLKTIGSSSCTYSFYYLDAFEDVEYLSDSIFSLKYGKLTGRLYSIIVSTTNDVHNKLWEDFKEVIKQKIGLHAEKVDRVVKSYILIRKIHYNDYKEL